MHAMRAAASISCIVVLSTCFVGCASRGPALQKYKPTRLEHDSALATWGIEAWRLAQDGQNAALIEVLQDPPRNTNTEVPRLIRRFLQLQDAAAQVDQNRVREHHETLQAQDAEFTDDWLGAVANLSELYTSGLITPTEKESIERTLRDVLASSLNAAHAAESDGDFSQAGIAWQVVASLSAVLGESETWSVAMHNARAASQPLTWEARSERRNSERLSRSIQPFTPAEYVQIIKVIVERHVDALNWRTLVLSGFDRLLVRADARLWQSAFDGDIAAEESLNAFIESVESIRDQFEIDSEAITCAQRSLCTNAATCIRRALEAIDSAAQDYGAIDFQDLGEAFIQGALLCTDSRTRMIWANEVPALMRQLGDDYVGIGAEVMLDPSGYPRLFPMPGSPAKQAGVQSGDLLVAIDGVNTTEQSLEDSVSRVIGPRDSSVMLSIQRGEESEDVIDIDVRRETVFRPTIVGWKQVGVDPSNHPRWDWLINRTLGVAYVRIDAFTPDTEREFRTAIDQADRTLGPGRQIEGLIIDLRGNTGGTKSAATRLIDLFLDSGSICATEDSSGNTKIQHAAWANTRLEGMPLVILMNNTSASASELLAGALQGSADAVVIGEQSFGKGSAQSLIEYGGSIVIVTTAWFGVPSEEEAIRFIDRSRQPNDWGIIPELTVFSSADDDEKIIGRRSGWFSYQGKDRPEAHSEFGAAKVLDLKDRALLLGLAILEARVLPVASQRSQAQTLRQ